MFALAAEWPEFPMFVREAGRLGPDAFDRFAAVIDPLRERAVAFLQTGMDDGEIRKQDPALLLFTLYTAVVGALTEASVLHAVVGRRHGAGVAQAARDRDAWRSSGRRSARPPRTSAPSASSWSARRTSTSIRSFGRPAARFIARRSSSDATCTRSPSRSISTALRRSASNPSVPAGTPRQSSAPASVVNVK